MKFVAPYRQNKIGNNVSHCRPDANAKTAERQLLPGSKMNRDRSNAMAAHRVRRHSEATTQLRFEGLPTSLRSSHAATTVVVATAQRSDARRSCQFVAELTAPCAAWCRVMFVLG